jgi:hypothetical protein
MLDKNAHNAAMRRVDRPLGRALLILAPKAH